MATVSGVAYDPIVRGGWNAGADYSSASNYLFMKADSTDDQAVTAGAGAQILGIRGNKPESGSPVEMHVGGISMVYLGGTVAIGAKLKSDASGQGVTADTDKDEYGAIALRAGVSGDLVPVLVTPGQTISI